MRTIVVLTDFSISARNAGKLAVVIAAQSGARIIVVNASSESIKIHADDPAFWPLETELIHDNETLLQLEAKRLRQYAGTLPSPTKKPDLSTILFKGTVKACLAELQKDHKIDLVAIGSGPKTDNNSRYTPSDIDAIQALATSPVLIVPENYIPDDTIRNICFVTDLAKSDYTATVYVKQLAVDLNAHLFIGHVSKPAFNMDADEEINTAAFMTKLEHLGLHSHEFQNYYDDDVIKGIETFCDDKEADLLIMVHKKHSQLWVFFHGSVTSVIRKRQHVPILLINERMA